MSERNFAAYQQRVKHLSITNDAKVRENYFKILPIISDPADDIFVAGGSAQSEKKRKDQKIFAVLPRDRKNAVWGFVSGSAIEQMVFEGVKGPGYEVIYCGIANTQECRKRMLYLEYQSFPNRIKAFQQSDLENLLPVRTEEQLKKELGFAKIEKECKDLEVDLSPELLQVYLNE